MITKGLQIFEISVDTPPAFDNDMPTIEVVGAAYPGNDTFHEASEVQFGSQNQSSDSDRQTRIRFVSISTI
jgi:hypothetical protein